MDTRSTKRHDVTPFARPITGDATGRPILPGMVLAAAALLLVCFGVPERGFVAGDHIGQPHGADFQHSISTAPLVGSIATTPPTGDPTPVRLVARIPGPHSLAR